MTSPKRSQESKQVNEVSKPHRKDDIRHNQRKRKMLRSLGLGLITGSSDDDLSAIGTYMSAGADLSMTNNRKIMRNHVNGRGINVLGWFTTAAVFAMRISSVISLFL